MRTDHIFYKLLRAFPETLFVLAGTLPPAAGEYRFDSVEVKETALRIDGVLVPSSTNQPYYFAEVQFQADKDIYWRLFTELLMYMRQSAPEGDWRAVLIFPNRTLDVEAPMALSTLAMDERLVRVYLDEIAVEEDGPRGPVAGWAGCRGGANFARTGRTVAGTRLQAIARRGNQKAGARIDRDYHCVQAAVRSRGASSDVHPR